jgi:hypothetical protein
MRYKQVDQQSVTYYLNGTLTSLHKEIILELGLMYFIDILKSNQDFQKYGF